MADRDRLIKKFVAKGKKGGYGPLDNVTPGAKARSREGYRSGLFTSPDQDDRSISHAHREMRKKYAKVIQRHR